MVMGSRLEGRGHFSTLYGRAPNDRFRYSSKVREGKHAVTHWEIVARGAICSLVRVQLETGRTHQIRVHLTSQNHPLVGDPQYGASRLHRFRSVSSTVKAGFEQFQRQALHAKELGFEHPITKRYVQFETPLPEDMNRLLETVRKWDEES